MAIVVTNIGTGTSAGATTTISVGSNIPAGATIYVLASEFPLTLQPTSPGTVADGTNTYTNIAFAVPVAGARPNAQVFQTQLTAQLNSGSTITYTPLSSGNGQAITAFYVTGLISGNPFDAATLATSFWNSGPPVPVTSGTPSLAGELFLEVTGYGIATSSPGFTLDTGNGWTNTPPAVIEGNSGGFFYGVGCGAQTNAGTSTKTGSPTFTSVNVLGGALIVLGLKPATTSSASITGTATVSATARLILAGRSSISGTGTVSAAAFIGSIFPSINGTATVSAKAALLAAASAAVTGSATVGVSAGIIHQISASILGTTSLTAVATLVHVATAANTIDPFVSVGAIAQPGVVADAANTIDPFVSHATAVAYKINFVPGTTVGATNPCLQTVIPSYLYEQYTDDDDLQAFVSAYNTIAQEYVTWLNAVGLPVYTGPLIVDGLLDWVAQGLYGVGRPVLSTGHQNTLGPFNTYDLDSLAFNAVGVEGNLVYTPVNDDIFKRVLTWKLYKGDGKIIDIRWLKRRVLRFLLGANGTDVDTANTEQISVTFDFGTGVTITTLTDTFIPVIRYSPFNKYVFNGFGYNILHLGSRLRQTISTSTHGNQVSINLLSRVATSIQGAFFNKFLGNSIVFNKYAATYQSFSPLPNVEVFKEAVEQGVLDMPFQFKTVVNIR